MTARRLLVAGVGLILLATVVLLLFARRSEGAGKLSGYVESEPLYLAAPIAGNVTHLEVRRGERVAAGAFLFTVDNRSLLAQHDSTAGQIAQAQAQQAGAEQTRGQLEAALAAARATAVQADRDAARARRLVEAGTLNRQEGERLRTAAETAHAQLTAAERQARAADAQILTERGRVRQYAGAQADLEARISQTSASAPGPARVEDVFFQQGEWVAANQPILALLPDERIRIRFFVPERQVARYRIGRRVQFSCDGCAPGLSALINYVSPRAEYTPPVIYSLESRDRLVFLVEAMPDNPGRLLPGQPIDVTPLGP